MIMGPIGINPQPHFCFSSQREGTRGMQRVRGRERGKKAMLTFAFQYEMRARSRSPADLLLQMMSTSNRAEGSDRS